MELRQLEIFRILSRELSFTRAAERAHCVQSNVSVQIRSLEQEFGVQLFERLGQQIRLTSHGRRLLPYAERILRLIDEAGTLAKDGDTPAGTLVIGSPESVLTYRLPPVLQAFRASFPDVELVIRGIGSGDLGSQLEQGQLDFCLVIEDMVKHPHLQVETLRSESVSLLADPQHPLATRRSVGIDDLAEQAFLLTDAGCAYRSKLEQAIGATHFRPKTVMEFSSVETIKQCAALGMGIACLPTIVAQAEIGAGKLTALRWSGPDLTMRALVAWHKDKWLSPAMEAFLALLRKSLKSRQGQSARRVNSRNSLR